MSILFILVAILALSVLVFVHELGHFLVGRALGFKILEFAIGFGPKIFKFTRKGIIYSIRIFPLGGFCRFYGEDEDVPEAGAMNSMPIWKRFLVLFAGSASNIVFAIIVGTILFTTVGDFGLAVNKVSKDSYAESAGLKQNDYIYIIDNKKVGLAGDISTMIKNAPNKFEMTVVRDGQLKDISVQKGTGNLIGIEVKSAHYKMGVLQAAERMVSYTVEIGDQILKFFGKLFTFNFHANEAAGPITTISIMGQATQMGFEWLVYLTVLISINLGIFNLIPLPALDGGRIFLLLVEAIRRKPIPRDKEAMVHFIGFALLIALVVFIEISNLIRSL